MKAILNSIHKYENRFDKKAERFIFHHHLLSILFTFILMPMLIVLAVGGGTIVIGLPLAWILGLL